MAGSVGISDVRALLEDAGFEPGTRRRGQAYAREGRVTHLQQDWEGDSLFASALVRGTQAYRTTVMLERTGPAGFVLRTSCTCPVAEWCKHTYALVAALSTTVLSTSAGDGRRPDWRAVLDEVLDEA
ncbi:MAG: SWIM zinc finger family protein, partial [Janthinobacterium lividum]